MKKLLGLLVMVIMSTIALLSLKVVAGSSTDASMKGYNVSDEWTFVDVISYPDKEVWGSKYYEGSMSSWMEAYKLYDNDTKSMYVLILCTSTMQPNQKSYWDQRRWNNQQMRVTMYPETTDTSEVSVVDYGPKTTVNTVEETSGITWSLGTDGVFSMEYSETTTIISPEVTISVLKGEHTTGQGAMNKINIMYNFKKYSSNTSLGNVYTSLVQENTFSIFKINNYDANKRYNFYVDNTNTFYRNGVFNSASVSGTYTGDFHI